MLVMRFRKLFLHNVDFCEIKACTEI
jgi:hypothetical protein